MDLVTIIGGIRESLRAERRAKMLAAEGDSMNDAKEFHVLGDVKHFISSVKIKKNIQLQMPPILHSTKLWNFSTV